MKKALPTNGKIAKDAKETVQECLSEFLRSTFQTQVLRWMDYIQHKQEFVGLFEKILLQKPGFEPPVTHPVGVVEADLKSNKTEQSVKNVSKSEVDSSKDKNKVEGEDLTFNMSLKVGNMSLVVALEQYISFFQR
ncbi:hypothetical protein D0Y65_024319 [Glycine soja]|uniref:Transcription factor CBF/NF-Y/archaeal histone domain-containing protein n=1 Tax=Glycine soja TaxID=3848 RepID=A0A445J1K5_GLYSO|nr:hypothetical protein D0Y65_024319 [Glycine soja]